jgi:class 3 adenylate cyclase/tetratricopeptide (TPR) repeat protein
MQQIAEWLANIGLERYAQAFIDNDIDVEVLRYLTDADLEKVGVSLGHRRKLLAAIAKLGGEAATPAHAPTHRNKQELAERREPTLALAAVASLPSSPSAEAAGERRYLTVMFCDLVGSTAISAQLDAEEWRDLVGSYLDAASAAVTEMDGYVAKKLGDGLMCLFGYPLAHENDAERAARAALSIQRALGELNRKNAGRGKPELVARIGLESGPAVVDAAGEIYGDVANIAARVQALAEPGAVLVTARVQRQIAGLFVVEERGTHTLKGVPDPAALFRLVRASGGGRRSGQRQLTPLVGRDEETAMLMRRWERAQQSDGQLVMIVGEPGLGKSRLIEEFHSRLSATPHTWVEWSCSQLLQNTPLHPIAEWGRQRFGGGDVQAEHRFADLENALAQVKLDAADNAALLGPLLDIPIPKERTVALGPDELRRRQLAALTNWVIAGAKIQSVVLALEDLHWADPTTLDVLRGIAERGALAPLLVLATTRPEFRPQWGIRSHHSTISLAPLDRAQVRDMVAELSARHALTKEVVEDVASRTGGVPLFVEEVTRLLLERGEQGDIQAIPPTLQQSLMARLDRLGPAREVAQIGSVIGRRFSYSLLRDVAGIEDAALQAALDRLADADIVLVQGLPPESDYRFKHALIQDAAYENLLKSRRHVLHRRVAEILRDRFADTAAAEPEVLAHHFTQTGLTEEAIEWWGKAGDQALRRSAFHEAISHLGKAIEMADRVSEVATRSVAPDPARLKLQTSLGNALIAARGHGAPETSAAFARASELSVGVDDPLERLSANYGVWVGSLSRAETDSLRAITEVILRDIEGKPPSPEVGVAHRLAGVTDWYLGNFAPARIHLEQTLDLFDPVRDGYLTYRFGQNIGVSAKAFLAFVLWSLGKTDQARAVGQEMVSWAVESGHTLTLVYGHFQYAVLNVVSRNPAAAASHADAVGSLAREHQMQLYTAYSGFLRPWSRWYLGDRDGGLSEMRRGIGACHELGNAQYTPLFETALAEAEAEAGEIEAALASIEHAISETERTGQRWNEADSHRVRGQILLTHDPANTLPAEDAFLTAIAVARKQKARSFELRAALPLARLYQSSSRAREAHGVLAPALDGFSPTPEFPEIEEAQKFLGTLTEDEQVRQSLRKQQARAKLHVDYARAMQWRHGFGAEEARAAIEKASELAAAVPGRPEYWQLTYARFAVSLMRGEFHVAGELAEAYLRQAELEGRAEHVFAARRMLGTVKFELGAFSESREEFDRMLPNWDEEGGDDLRAGMGADALCVGWGYMAQLLTILGEVRNARRLSEDAIRRAESLGDFGSLAFATGQSLLVLALTGHTEAVLHRAEAFETVVSEKGAQLWISNARGWASWARGLLTHDAAGAVAELRGVIVAKSERQELQTLHGWYGLLSELQAEAGAVDEALVSIAEGLALAEQTAGHRMDAHLYRLRGDILTKCDAVGAEEAYRKSLRIAREQGARTFELQAGHALAKFYHGMNRATDAYAVLVGALEGFTPTSEFLEIGEAHTLLELLKRDGAVQAEWGRRERRVQLQLAYGTALMSARGYGADETVKAFDRARELSAGIGGSVDRLALSYGTWLGAVTTEGFEAGRKTAAALLAEATQAGKAVGIGTAHRAAGATLLYGGFFHEARRQFDAAEPLLGTTNDRELARRFNGSPRAAAHMLGAMTAWITSDFGAAAREAEAAAADAERAADAMTQGYVYGWAAIFGAVRRDVPTTGFNARRLLKLVAHTGLRTWAPVAEQLERWSRSMSGDGAFSVRELLAARSALKDVGHDKIVTPVIAVIAAEAEVRSGRADVALALLEQLIIEVRASGLRWQEAELLRVSGEARLLGSAADLDCAGSLLETAINISREQGARAFELRAALSLAKLYQSTGRASEAYGVLAPALEGFAPTTDFPTVAEAQVLLNTLGS